MRSTASLALALVLIYQATHVINFAQGELAMLTTFIAYQLIQWGLSYWEAFFATLAIAFVLGIASPGDGDPARAAPLGHRDRHRDGRPVHPHRRRRRAGSGAASSSPCPSPFGFGSCTTSAASPSSISTSGRSSSSSSSLAAVWGLFRFTKLGLAMRAAALRPAAASLAGVRVDAMLAIGWGLAAVLGAVAGLMTRAVHSCPPRPDVHAADPRLRVRRRRARRAREPRRRRRRRPRDRRLPDLLIGYVPQISSELQLPFSFARDPRDPPRQAERALRPPGGAAGMRRQPPRSRARSPSSRSSSPCCRSSSATTTSTSPPRSGSSSSPILGLNILTGYTGQISIGHGAFMAIGGYTAAIMSRDHHTNLSSRCSFAFAICFVAGLLFGLPALRLSGAYLALATFALAISIPQLPLQWSTYLGGSLGVQARRRRISRLHLPGSRSATCWLYGVAWAAAGDPLRARVADPARARRPRVPRRARQRDRGRRLGSRDRRLQDARLRDLRRLLRSRRSALRHGARTASRSPTSSASILSLELLIGAAVAGLGSLWGILVGAAFVGLLPKISTSVPVIGNDHGRDVVYGLLVIARDARAARRLRRSPRAAPICSAGLESRVNPSQTAPNRSS